MKSAVIILLLLIAPASCKFKHDYDYRFTPGAVELIDGEYLGEVDKDSDRAKVRIVIKNGKVAEVEILDVFAFGWRYQALKEQMPPRFIKAQHPGVDAVTGATGSSHAIKIAFDIALRKAMKK